MYFLLLRYKLILGLLFFIELLQMVSVSLVILFFFHERFMISGSDMDGFFVFQ